MPPSDEGAEELRPRRAIKLREGTVERLLDTGTMRDTMDSLILRLLDEHEELVRLKTLGLARRAPGPEGPEPFPLRVAVVPGSIGVGDPAGIAGVPPHFGARAASSEKRGAGVR